MLAAATGGATIAESVQPGATTNDSAVAATDGTTFRSPLKEDAMIVADKTVTVIRIEHATIASRLPFDRVRAALERRIPKLDAAVLAIIHSGDARRALAMLEAGPPLAIFGSRDHGALLVIAGQQRKALQYEIGNMLTASLMTRHQISAALYAPVRVLLREDENGITAFEYDRPATLFGQFGRDDLNEVAGKLDRLLEDTLLDAAAGR